MTPLVTGTKVPHAGVLATLETLLESAGIRSCKVTSVSRTAADQARIMYENCMHDLPEQKRTYKAPGQAVIAVFEQAKILPADQVIKKMLAKIMEVGPDKVSHHILPADAPIMAIDIAKNSFVPEEKRLAFWVAANGSPAVEKILDENNAYHVEVRKSVAPAVQT